MLRNDLHTRITEDAIRRNGGADTAELSRKLDNLQRVIESQIRRKSPSPQPPRRSNRYSPEPHRMAPTYGRCSEGYGESMIVPDYRALLYHGGSGGSGGGSNGGRSGSGSSWREYSGGAQGGRKSRYDLTYGDVIQGGHRDYDAPSSSSLYADTLDRVPVTRRLDSHTNPKREYRDYWPSTRPRGDYRGYSGRHGGYGGRSRAGTSPRTYADQRGRSGARDNSKRKYDNPLMRDSSGSENDNNDDDDEWVDQDVFKKRQSGGIKSRLGVRSRPPFKNSGGGYNFAGFGNLFVKRARGGGRGGRGFNRGGGGGAGPGGTNRPQRSRSFTRPMTRNSGGGAVARSRSQGRPAITKEDLDKELDEYHRKKGLTDEATTMQVDS
ncbi:RNA-binding protein FUS-like isoform X2 [Varroa destructor]|nr:RNA-binding protein FUS-like isoform X2 [Varroa destructor]